MIKTFIYDLVYVFLNYIVSYIPCWKIRKFIYRLAGLQIGKGSRICMRTRLMEPWNIVIGNNSIVNESCILDGRGRLRIGDNCSVSTESILYTASHIADSEEFKYYEKETVIGNGVWIGARAVVLPGVVIGNYSMIGACSLVSSGEYEAGFIYAGIPAKKKKSRGINHIKDLNHKVLFR